MTSLTPTRAPSGSRVLGPADVRPTLRTRWRALEVSARRPGETMMSIRSQLVIALASLALLAVGLLTRAFGSPALGSTLLALFLALGVGVAASLTAGRMTSISFTVYSASVGLVITTAVGFAMAQTGLWYPRAAYVVVAAAAAVLLLRVVRRDIDALRETPRAARPATATTTVVVTVTAVAGLAVAGATAAAQATSPERGGLLASVGPVWFIGCALIAIAFGLAVWARVSPAAPVLAAGSVVILSQALLYQAPTVMAAARHLGLTEFIRSSGSVDASQDIYQAWPGLFAGAAWMSAGTGLTDLLALATWWPVLVTPVAILAVRLLAGRFLSAHRAWLAAAVFALGDAVNSTYFAPQVFGFVLSVVVLALLVSPPATESQRRRGLRFGFAVALILAVVVTHQISPFMLFFALVALVLFRLVRPWWTPLLVLVPALSWALLHRHLLARYVDINAIGSLFGNIAPPEHPDAVAGVVPVTRLVFYVPAAALVCLGLIALAVVIRRRDRLHLGLAAALVSPLGLALATNYGQEGVFRIVLFAVPWLAILVASAALPSRAATRAALAAAFLLMMAVNTFGQTGLDWARILRPGDAAVTTRFEQVADRGATLLSAGTKNATPTRITQRYDEVGYTSRLRVGGMPKEVGAAYDPQADLRYLTQEYTATHAPGGHYLYLSDAIGAYDDRYGLQKYADYLRLRDAVAGSDEWVQVVDSSTATLYKLRNEPITSGG